MKVLKPFQLGAVGGSVQAKFSLVAPILYSTLFSLNRARVARLGGPQNITLWDVAREMRESNGDSGVCFEYAVHHAIMNQNDLIYPLVSEVLERLCDIPGGANSILFGPEKDGAIPVVETVQNSLTDDSLLYVGSRGRPPKLKRHIPAVVQAFRSSVSRGRLPASIRGIWKADLFLGNTGSEKWVATTVKSNGAQLVGAQGLRVGIYPKINAHDSPRLDQDLNLVRIPLPYDGQFSELFNKSFFLVRAFLLADASLPKPIDLPDAEDRYIVEELSKRREFPVIEVIDLMERMGQPGLVGGDGVEFLGASAEISEAEGLKHHFVEEDPDAPVSISPIPHGFS